MKIRDWKKGMEESAYFMSIVDNDYFEDPFCIEHALYAKTLKKPTILFVQKGTEFTIPDLFENILIRIEFRDVQDFKERKREIMKNVFEVIEWLK